MILGTNHSTKRKCDKLLEVKQHCTACRGTATHVSYCNRACQMLDWPVHKQVCAYRAKGFTGQGGTGSSTNPPDTYAKDGGTGSSSGKTDDTEQG